ncbi:MAG: hypothetical protein QG625_3521 [Cyanobacteriota bacterium erpe_2018_sw_39hr_WHONDRS-SW48-000098_B_bin.30]|jgi:hypothetical protein|nr:hypothetical protein [Candidatus Obscuribacter sp.]MBK7838805.1 hypothetical protein [Candidatus Obscuribacter sp.]MBK9619657.1 hypothetical protein [Candidatus Obscuribacter sp.]MDQ5967365.1 hypothetical protein [Cyanobacteriota bacterium erpe_2018_sw_39hr_WHONDRS-SW48-000098_B_bin.30]
MLSESIELNETNWTGMVHLIYQILDGEVGLMEGCSQLCKQADEYNLLTLSCFDWFVQLDLHFDKFLTGAAAAELPARRNAFEERKREEIIAKLKLLMLQLREPVFTLQYVAETFLKGDWTAQQAVMAMRRPIVVLGLDQKQPYDSLYSQADWVMCRPVVDPGLDEKEPYVSLYRLADDFYEMPSGDARQLWHPDLLKRKEQENAALCKRIAERVKVACEYILEHPIPRKF